jgi:quinol monooxygenase YgiN
VQVTFKVKEGDVNKFIEYTKSNVNNSIKEKGVKRFEFYVDSENNNYFELFEIYESKEDQLKHRETEHFKLWKNKILVLIEEPYSIKQLDLI